MNESGGTPTARGGGAADLLLVAALGAAGVGVWALTRKTAQPANACRPPGGRRDTATPDPRAFYPFTAGQCSSPSTWARIVTACCPSCGADDLAWLSGFTDASQGSPDATVYLPKACSRCAAGQSLTPPESCVSPAPTTYLVTAPLGLNVRAGPASWCPKVGYLPFGARVQVQCQSRGERVNGSSVWDSIPGYGNMGWIADGWVSTPGVDVFLPGTTVCQTQACPGTSPPPPPPSAVWPRVGWIVSDSCAYGTADYVIVADGSSPVGIKKRWLQSAFAFTSCGYRRNYIHILPSAVLRSIPDGDWIAGVVQIVGPSGAFTINTCPGTVSLAPGGCPG